MDGLKGDTDIIIILATNRPLVLEAALAVPRGRIDHGNRGAAARYDRPRQAGSNLWQRLAAGRSHGH